MIVTVKKVKEQYYEVFANERSIGIFNIKTIKKLNIKDKFDYDLNYIKKIQLIGKLQSAKKKAVELLTYKDHSKKELYLKLTKSYSKEISKYVIKYLEKKGYVNDKRYAKDLAANLVFKKNKGENFIFLELLKKGVSSEIAKETVHSLNCDFVKEIENLILKKYSKNLKDYITRKKLISKLLRRGYKYTDINTAIKNILI